MSLAAPLTRHSEGAPGTEGRIETLLPDDPLFSEQGLDSDKWRIRKVPVGDKDMLHMQFTNWKDGQAPSTAEDTAQIQTAIELLTDPRSYLLRSKDWSDEQAEQIPLTDFSLAPAVFYHW